MKTFCGFRSEPFGFHMGMPHHPMQAGFYIEIKTNEGRRLPGRPNQSFVPRFANTMGFPVLGALCEKWFFWRVVWPRHETNRGRPPKRRPMVITRSQAFSLAGKSARWFDPGSSRTMAESPHQAPFFAGRAGAKSHGHREPDGPGGRPHSTTSVPERKNPTRGTMNGNCFDAHGGQPCD